MRREVVLKTRSGLRGTKDQLYIYRLAEFAEQKEYGPHTAIFLFRVESFAEFTDCDASLD